MPEVIAPGEVHVWYGDPASVPYDDPRLLRWLTADERAKLARRSLERPRREYLMTRALVRLTLSRYVEVDPLAWQFTAGEHGKPSVLSPTLPFHFNLTHTHGLIALALAHEPELGIDAEDLSRKAPLEITDHYFAPLETQALRSLPPEAQPERFLLLWTLKEAYLKACARGLSVPLSHFWIDLREGAPRLRFSPALEDDEARWQTVAWRPTPNHQLALALPSRRAPILRERWMSF